MSKSPLREERDDTYEIFQIEITAINSYINTFYHTVYPLHKDILQECIEYSLIAEGKRYRSLLCILCGELVGVRESDILPFAVAIEMIHTYSLIHDDLPALDNDTMRRGKATHHIYFGEAQAILAGDALLTDAFYAMTLTQCSASRVMSAIREISIASGSNGMVAGQMLDMMGEKSGLSIEEIHRLKTGAIIQASCVVAGILAGSSDQVREELSEFGYFFGILFQIVDDILDEIGVSSKLGKSVGKDKASGKKTFVTEYGLQIARDKAQEYYLKTCATLSILQNDSVERNSCAKLQSLVDCVYNRIR